MSCVIVIWLLEASHVECVRSVCDHMICRISGHGDQGPVLCCRPLLKDSAQFQIQALKCGCKVSSPDGGGTEESLTCRPALTDRRTRLRETPAWTKLLVQERESHSHWNNLKLTNVIMNTKLLKVHEWKQMFIWAVVHQNDFKNDICTLIQLWALSGLLFEGFHLSFLIF